MVLRITKCEPVSLRADLRDFRRSEAARKGELDFVSHILVAKHQNGMFFEGRARRRVGGVVRSDIRKGHPAQFGGKARADGNDFHWQVPRCGYGPGEVRAISSARQRGVLFAPIMFWSV